jgi:hypothetical protein
VVSSLITITGAARVPTKTDGAERLNVLYSLSYRFAGVAPTDPHEPPFRPNPVAAPAAGGRHWIARKGIAMSCSPAPEATFAPAARTIEGTCEHYGWTRTYVFSELARGRLIAVKAGRRTLVTTESAEQLFASLPRAVYRAPAPKVDRAARAAAAE